MNMDYKIHLITQATDYNMKYIHKTVQIFFPNLDMLENK